MFTRNKNIGLLAILLGLVLLICYLGDGQRSDEDFIHDITIPEKGD